MPNEQSKHANAPEYRQLLPPLFCFFFITFRFFFYYFYALFCTFCRFFQLLDQSTLNSMYNKDLHKYFPPKYTSREEFTHRLCGASHDLSKTNPILRPTQRPNTQTLKILLQFHILLCNYSSAQGALLLIKCKKKAAFCNFLTLTHLTPCTTKTYINISPQNTLQERNLPAVFLAGKNAKRTQFTDTTYAIRNTPGVYPPFFWRDIRNTKLFMKNKPNFTNTQINKRLVSAEGRIYSI